MMDDSTSGGIPSATSMELAVADPALMVPAEITFRGCSGIVVEGEFYVRDTIMAERFGLKRPADVRNMIRQRLDHLAQHGLVRSYPRQSVSGKGRTTNVLTYYLNKRQALTIAMLMRTEKAIDLSIQMVQVFDDYQSGRLAAASGQLPPHLMHIKGVQDALIREREAMVAAVGVQLQKWHMADAAAGTAYERAANLKKEADLENTRLDVARDELSVFDQSIRQVGRDPLERLPKMIPMVGDDTVADAVMAEIGRFTLPMVRSLILSRLNRVHGLNVSDEFLGHTLDALQRRGLAVYRDGGFAPVAPGSRLEPQGTNADMALVILRREERPLRVRLVLQAFRVLYGLELDTRTVSKALRRLVEDGLVLETPEGYALPPLPDVF